MKILGSNKINGYCPADIKIKISSCGSVEGSYCSTHVGHTNELGRLRLSADEREAISEKIAADIPFDSILESVRNSVTGTFLKRSDMLTRKDLHNIASNYDLKAKAIRHKYDLVSVDAWVKELGNFYA